MENQNFRYVMMFRHRGTEQFHLPRTLGHCETSARACRYLRFAVNAAKNQQFMDMLNCFDVCCACLRALYELTDWFPNPAAEILRIQDLLNMLYDRNRKGVRS